MQLYQHSQHPEARQRSIRVLERQELYQAALSLAQVAQQGPVNDAEHQHLLRIIPRLRRKLGLAALAVVKSTAPDRLDLCLPRDAASSVEQQVVAHLHTGQASVHYVENTLINGLFGLLCWPAIFAPLRGIFHPYQVGPADLHEDDFIISVPSCSSAAWRSSMMVVIGPRLARPMPPKGLQSPFVAWNHLPPDLLEEALECLPAAHPKLWFRRLLLDIRANRTGMPDLIQLYPEQKTYRMIEGQGPG